MRARGWKAGAIGAGDLGFGCARKTKLAGGAHGSAAAALAEAAEAGADRWALGRLLASARGERGLARAALVGAGRWQAERGWRVGPRKGGTGAAVLLALAGRAGRRRRGLRSVGRRGENWAGVERDWAARGLIWAGIWD